MFRDGPLTRRAPETIRYGTGRCALGALLVASSERGIVSIMVRDTRSRLIRDLSARFPRAHLVRDEMGGKATVAKVARYIAAPFRPLPSARLPARAHATGLPSLSPVTGYCTKASTVARVGSGAPRTTSGARRSR
jgi:hypothetical protein